MAVWLNEKKDFDPLPGLSAIVIDDEFQIFQVGVICYCQRNHLYKYESGHEAELIAFSPRRQHLVFYILNNIENQQKLLDKLGKHKTGKIFLCINKLSDVNPDIPGRDYYVCV